MPFGDSRRQSEKKSGTYCGTCAGPREMRRDLVWGAETGEATSLDRGIERTEGRFEERKLSKPAGYITVWAEAARLGVEPGRASGLGLIHTWDLRQYRRVGIWKSGNSLTKRNGCFWLVRWFVVRSHSRHKPIGESLGE